MSDSGVLMIWGSWRLKPTPWQVKVALFLKLMDIPSQLLWTDSNSSIESVTGVQGFRQNVGKSVSCLWGRGGICSVSNAWDLLVGGVMERSWSLPGGGQLEAKQF